jgi:signal transduction histidine kinase
MPPTEPTPDETSLRATHDPSGRAPERAPQARGDAAEERCGTELERDVRAFSHGIRSPLVALKGFAGLLDEECGDRLGESGRHFLKRIDEASRRIEWRLNDFAQLRSIHDEGPSRGWIDPSPLIEALATAFKAALDETGMRILMSNDPPLVYCDQAELEVALTHLVGNALQHGVPSEPRHVQIHITRDETATRLCVCDDGPGMDESIARRAFEPFESAGDRRRRFDDGRESTGIGLALARRIAEAHGGTARLETGPGEGTRVFLTFPHE